MTIAGRCIEAPARRASIIVGMSHEVTIRAATVADARTLVELRERMLVELDRTDESRLAALAERATEWFADAFPDGRAFGWLAEKDGAVVGGVSMTVIHTQPQYMALSGEVAQVFGLFVEPVERGAGIATALVRAAVAHAKALGFEIITLHAATRARPIYERIGFDASSEMRLFLSRE